MNLTELQIQLRAIEKHIFNLQTEIENMKPQPEDEKKAMLEKITELASKYPLKGRRFPKISNADAKIYISCLAYISLADDSNIYDKLLFLCRLSYGMGLPMSSEDIFKTGLEFDRKSFSEACTELKKQYSFLVDALILVNITEEATDASFGLIADIARIFECEKEGIHTAAMVAKAVLIDDFNILNQIPVSNRNGWMDRFKEHTQVWIESQRIKCGVICTKNEALVFEKKVCVIADSMKTGEIVKKGDILISYKEAVYSYGLRISPISPNWEKRTIIAPCDGMVFFIENNKSESATIPSEKYLEVYVVSYFDDYKEFCDWYKKENRGKE